MQDLQPVGIWGLVQPGQTLEVFAVEHWRRGVAGQEEKCDEGEVSLG